MLISSSLHIKENISANKCTHLHAAEYWAKDFLLVALHLRLDPVQDGGAHEVALLVARNLDVRAGMRLKFHQKSGSSEFSGISDYQRSYVLLEMNRS